MADCFVMARLGVLVVCCFVVAGATRPMSGHSAVPSTQTCKASNLGLTFTLPSDWACENGGAPPAPRYAGVAPGRTAQLEVSTAQTTSSAPLSVYANKLVEAVRRQYAHAGTGLAITSTNTKVDSTVPALRVSASYQGVWLQGAGERGQITHLIYFVLRGGVLFAFDYSAVTPWATKDIPAFMASARSIHFVSVA
jgi:hypothetical protein